MPARPEELIALRRALGGDLGIGEALFFAALWRKSGEIVPFAALGGEAHARRVLEALRPRLQGRAATELLGGEGIRLTPINDWDWEGTCAGD